MTQIVGMMFCKNEADIIEESISDAVTKVDQLYVCDDGSSDSSWEIIQSCKFRFPNLTHIQKEPNKNDPGQRTSLFNKIKKRFKPEDTWVQVIEADMFLLMDPREAIKFAVDDLAVTWNCMNAVRKPGTWKEVDTYPNWNGSIRNIMPYAHWMEVLLYTFRPLPGLHYSSVWRPWPQGFSKYSSNKILLKRGTVPSGAPGLLHCGYRGPTHFYQKYKSMGKVHKKYPTWELTSPEAVERTVPFFGLYAENAFDWKRCLQTKKEKPESTLII